VSYVVFFEEDQRSQQITGKRSTVNYSSKKTGKNWHVYQSSHTCTGETFLVPSFS